MLQEELEKLRNLHPDVTIIYADYYGAALNIFRAPLQFGEYHFQIKTNYIKHIIRVMLTFCPTWVIAPVILFDTWKCFKNSEKVNTVTCSKIWHHLASRFLDCTLHILRQTKRRLSMYPLYNYYIVPCPFCFTWCHVSFC